MSTYVICEPCIGTKDGSCVDVCPAACIHTTPEAPQHYIDPDICIACEQCEIVCPVDAIYLDTDVPPQWQDYIEVNAAFFRQNKVQPGELDAERAQAAIAAIQDYATRQGLAVSVAVVDQTGQPVASGRMPTAAGDSLDQALKKAYTSVIFRVGTHELGARRNQPWLEADLHIDESRILAVAGALPIVDGPSLLGAVGVAGSPTSDQDVSCCQVALTMLESLGHRAE